MTTIRQESCPFIEFIDSIMKMPFGALTLRTLRGSHDFYNHIDIVRALRSFANREAPQLAEEHEKTEETEKSDKHDTLVSSVRCVVGVAGRS